MRNGHLKTICSEAASETPGMSRAWSSAMVAPMDPAGTLCWEVALKKLMPVPMLMTGRTEPVKTSDGCGWGGRRGRRGRAGVAGSARAITRERPARGSAAVHGESAR